MAKQELWVCDNNECGTKQDPLGGKNATQGWGTVTIDYHGQFVSCLRTVSLYCPICLKIRTQVESTPQAPPPARLIDVGMSILTKATKTPGRIIDIEPRATYVVMTYNGFKFSCSESEFG